MSLKNEQYRALHEARKFLRDLLRGPRSPRKVIKDRAYRCLKHFPGLRANGEPMFSEDPFDCPDICTCDDEHTFWDCPVHKTGTIGDKPTGEGAE